MTDTPSEPDKTNPPAPAGDPKVPVAALAKERADKRAARSEADQAREQLEQAKQSFDPEVLKELAATMAAKAKETIEAEVAPLRAKLQRYEIAVKHGLSEKQMDLVTGILERNPNLTAQQAIVLARSEKPGEFLSDARTAGGFPTTGNSLARDNPPTEDPIAMMQQARERGDFRAAGEWAKKGVLAMFASQFTARSNKS